MRFRPAHSSNGCRAQPGPGFRIRGPSPTFTRHISTVPLQAQATSLGWEQLSRFPARSTSMRSESLSAGGSTVTKFCARIPSSNPRAARSPGTRSRSAESTSGVVSHGYDASSQDNFDHLHRLFDDYASPHSWPSYVFATLTPRGGDGPFTVFFAADHSIIDGFSIVLVAHEIAALYREASTGSAANLFPVGSYVDFGAVEREQMADMEAEKAAVEIWRKALGTDGLPPSSRYRSVTVEPILRTACRPGCSTPTSPRPSVRRVQPPAWGGTSPDFSADLPL